MAEAKSTTRRDRRSTLGRASLLGVGMALLLIGSGGAENASGTLETFAEELSAFAATAVRTDIITLEPMSDEALRERWEAYAEQRRAIEASAPRVVRARLASLPPALEVSAVQRAAESARLILSAEQQLAQAASVTGDDDDEKWLRVLRERIAVEEERARRRARR